MILTEAQLHELHTDPNWQDIGNLPSNFYPYKDFGKLLIRPFNVTHLMLLSKAVVTKDLTYQLQAVDKVISQDVMDITIGDYYYILEWLKLHSTTDSPIVAEWHCPHFRSRNKETGEYIPNSSAGLELAATLKASDYDLVPCGTHNTETLYQVNLNVLQLPENDWPGLPEGFDFPRVKQLIDIREATKNPELSMLVSAAQWVAGSTFDDKLATLVAQNNLDMFMQAQAINDTVVHGISKTATLHCRTCGAEHPHTLTLDTISFFR